MRGCASAGVDAADLVIPGIKRGVERAAISVTIRKRHAFARLYL